MRRALFVLVVVTVLGAVVVPATAGARDASRQPKGGNLTFGLEAETTDYCLPRAQLAISGIQVAAAIYDTLTVPNAQGEIVPYLAKSVTPDATFTTWTIALRPGPRGWQACATPFYGSGGPAMARVNDRAPLRGLCFLCKSTRFGHRRLTPSQVVSRAFPEVMLPKRDARVTERLLATLTSLAAAVPAWELAFAPEPAIWSYLDGMD